LAKLALALDLPDARAARALAERVAAHVDVLKIGLELFVSEGPAAVEIGRDLARPVFLDLKLHDIPETVERAVARSAALGARMVTVHASGGRAMLERAAERGAREGIDVVAVTVLTSLADEDLAHAGIAGTTREHALRLAKMARACGVRHFVCSPQEVTDLRAALGKDVVLVTPGIRQADGQAGDQKRFTTPQQAARAGADLLVVGRPIRDASDPASAAADIARAIR
jgi:orotidine-5'-phosphate decarboxylase